MPFSLGLYLYRWYQRRVQETFEENNRVLSQKDIEDILENCGAGRALRMFRSAVVDHVPVDGKPLHLRYPAEVVFYHDQFKRAFIAEGIGGYAPLTGEEDLGDAVMILKTLAVSDDSQGFVRVLAWDSLGKVGRLSEEVIDEVTGEAFTAFSGNVASLLGALLFCERIRGGPARDKALKLIAEGGQEARYRVQRALLNYYLFQCPDFPDPRQTEQGLEEDIHVFLSDKAADGLFTTADFLEGLREVGLLGYKQTDGLWPGTLQEKTAVKLKKSCGRYIEAAGAYARMLNGSLL